MGSGVTRDGVELCVLTGICQFQRGSDGDTDDRAADTEVDLHAAADDFADRRAWPGRKTAALAVKGGTIRPFRTAPIRYASRWLR